MSVTIASDSPLTSLVTGIEERQCELIGRHRDLRDKVATMERSIPALMAYNLWTIERESADAPYYKVREMMKKFSPYPDPADKLVAELKNTVNDLRQETEQLHDKIVDADVKLEETDMELASLELANKETEERLVQLQNDVGIRSSLHSIHSEDLLCLRKIRQLAEEELKLKNCLKQLETKEITYRRQMNKLLPCKKNQYDNAQTRRDQKPDKRELSYSLNDRKGCFPTEMKEKYPIVRDKGRKSTNCCSCATSTTFTYDETLKKFDSYEDLHSRSASLDSRTSSAKKRKDDCQCCGTCREISTVMMPPKASSSVNVLCESLNSVPSEISTCTSVKSMQPVPCDLGKTCKECETSAACRQMDKYDCKECVCAYESSISSRDCNVVPTGRPRSRKAHRSRPTSRSLRMRTGADDSDDEFCDCCPCGAGIHSDSENSP